MPNIIFENGSHLRTTQCSASETYGIESLLFYIPNSYDKSQIFLMLKNNQGLYEIVELTKVKRDKNHMVYQIAVNQNLRVSNDLMNLAILILNADGTYSFSDEIALNLTTNRYVLAKQVFIAQQVGAQVQEHYKKIVALTEENKKIYDYMKGACQQ